MAYIDHAEMLELLHSKRGFRTIREQADEIGVSHGYLGDVVRGRRLPGRVVLSYLGLTKMVAMTVTYREKGKR